MKKIFIILLLFVSSIATGQTSLSGSGTSIDPYQIWDAQDMDSVRYYPFTGPLYFKLMANIDLDSSITGQTWTPIGYTGSIIWKNRLDGNHYTVSNMQVYTDGSDAQNTTALGFFASIQNTGLGNQESAVQDIVFNNCSVELDGSYSGYTVFAGIISGKADGGVYTSEDFYTLALTNVVVKNSTIQVNNVFTPYQSNIGGIAGSMGSGIFLRCSFQGDIIVAEDLSAGNYSALGGLAANGVGAIQCISKANIQMLNYTTTQYFRIGGFFGGMYTSGTISDSYYKGRMEHNIPYSSTSGAGRGGLIGTTNGATVQIDNVYVSFDTLNIISPTNFGVFVGTIRTNISGSGIVMDTTYASEFAMVARDTIANSYPEPSEITRELLSDVASFPTFDFGSTWSMLQDGYPSLIWADGDGFLRIKTPSNGDIYTEEDTISLTWSYKRNIVEVGRSGTDISIYLNNSLYATTTDSMYSVVIEDDGYSTIKVISEDGYRDSVYVFAYPVYYGVLEILSASCSSLNIASFNIDSLYYYSSVDSVIWTYEGIYYPPADTFTMPVDLNTVYVKVENANPIDTFSPSESYNDMSSLPGTVDIFCHSTVWNTGTTNILVDESCGWVSGYIATVKEGYLDYAEQKNALGVLDTVPVWKVKTIEKRAVDQFCKPDGALGYNLNWDEWICSASGVAGYPETDTLSAYGRDYFRLNDIYYAYDTVNDTTYEIFDVSELSKLYSRWYINNNFLILCGGELDSPESSFTAYIKIQGTYPSRTITVLSDVAEVDCYVKKAYKFRGMSYRMYRRPFGE